MTTVVNRRFQEFDIYIGRGSIWGNQYSHLPSTKASVIVGSRAEAIERYRVDLVASCNQDDPVKRKAFRAELAKLHGKRLGCYCAPAPCHGDVLAIYAAKAYSEQVCSEIIDECHLFQAAVG